MAQRLSEPENYLVAHIREALANDPRVNELGLTVTISGSKIFVTGEVATAQRKDAVAEVVREVCPDHQVYNETAVRQLLDVDEPEELL